MYVIIRANPRPGFHGYWAAFRRWPDEDTLVEVIEGTEPTDGNRPHPRKISLATLAMLRAEPALQVRDATERDIERLTPPPPPPTVEDMQNAVESNRALMEELAAERAEVAALRAHIAELDREIAAARTQAQAAAVQPRPDEAEARSKRPK